MGFQSRKLLHYFFGAKYDASCRTSLEDEARKLHLPESITVMVRDFIPKSTLIPSDPLISNMLEPGGLRGTMMLAGLHFKLMTSGSKMLDPAFFYHKWEAIHLVNDQLGRQSSDTRSTCVKLIAILSIMESCGGNSAVADAHIRGLLALLERQELEQSSTNANIGYPDNTQVAERMLLIAHHFAAATRCRSTESFLDTTATRAGMMHMPVGMLYDNLSALRLMPALFNDRVSTTDVVDVSAIIASLKGLAYAASNAHKGVGSSPYLNLLPSWKENAVNICTGNETSQCLGCRCLAGVLLSLIITLSSLGSNVETSSDDRMMCSWQGFAIASSFFLNGVLGVWNLGQPLEAPLATKLASLLRREMAESEDETLEHPQGRKLWFWKAFVTGYSLQAAQPHRNLERLMSQAIKYSEEDTTSLLFFQALICRWSSITGIVRWEDARAILESIAWPNFHDINQKAEQLWWQTTSDLGGSFAKLG
ncbi:hypothetical protein BX600DRAFT_553040 [Xylariales sp. PMI_506]|nr:hypothetical protein BX600DRAFT_553040 [Xylariales sp. PMI_506]